MSEYTFGLRGAALTRDLLRPKNRAKLRKIEEEKGVSWTSYEGPEKRLRSWFSGPNKGEPFDRWLAADVLSLMVAAGLDTKDSEEG